jgi:hypothetical protein
MSANKKSGSRRREKTKAEPKTAPPRGDGSDAVYQLKITLLDTSPPIWRRFALPATATLETLHQVIQIVMGWQESHLLPVRRRGTRLDRQRS